MQAGDVIMSARDKYGVPQTSNNWNDARMLRILQDACDDISIESDFPEASYTVTTQAGIREYAMVECVKILRGYLVQNGVFAQPLPGTDIPTLQGDVLMIYDQSSGQINGLPQYSPQWAAEAPQGYPLTNSGQGRPIVPTALPYFSVTASAQRGMLYRRGGNVGVDPPPAQSGLILAVDFIPLQPIVSVDTSFMIYPRIYKDALAARMCYYMAGADVSPRAQMYDGEYKGKLPDIRMWLDNLMANKPKRLTPITKRTFSGYGSWGGGGGGIRGDW